jgi:hypothetical protein
MVAWTLAERTIPNNWFPRYRLMIWGLTALYAVTISSLAILIAAHRGWAAPWVELIALAVVITPAFPLLGFEILPGFNYEIQTIDADSRGLTLHRRTMFRNVAVSVPWSDVLRVDPGVKHSKVWFVECIVPFPPGARRKVIVADSAMRELRARLPDRIRPPTDSPA